MDFVAIDFETANRNRNSACCLGIVEVSDGRIVSSNSYLIKPEPFVFEPYNISIHGITPENVSSAPTFAELWPNISPFFQKGIVVAHNAVFDISVLKKSLAHYDIPTSDIDVSVLCSYRLSQSAFPELSSFRLNVVCKYLDIPLDHHNAVSDAEASAAIVCRVASEHNTPTLHKIAKEFSLRPGYLRGDSYKCCRWRKGRVDDIVSVDLDDDTLCVDDDFLGKNFVFTGTLLSMTRAKAQDIVRHGGGNVQSGVNKLTNYLVVGLQDITKLNGFNESTKTRKAQELRAQGHDIQIIGEDDFVNMIDDELYNLCMLGK